MEEVLADYSQVQLQENIPLSEEEIDDFETQQRSFTKTIPIVLSGSTLFVMAIAAFSIKDHFSSFKYYDYLLFAAGGLALYGFAYLMALLVSSYDQRNWKRDKIQGKSKLSSVIISRDETEYGEYLTFAGKSKNDKIRLQVKHKDYSHFLIGSKVVVTYLKYSKVILTIHELDNFKQ